MKFIYKKYADLAKLGWCMAVDKQSDEVVVHCGEYVETA